MSSSEQKNPESAGEASQGICRMRIGGAVLSGVLGILSFPVFGRPYQLDLELPMGASAMQIKTGGGGGAVTFGYAGFVK